MVTFGVLVLAGLVLAWALAYHAANRYLWSGAALLWLAAVSLLANVPAVALSLAWGVAIAASVLFCVAPLRRAVVSGPILQIFRRVSPTLSKTEQDALDAAASGGTRNSSPANPIGRHSLRTRHRSSRRRSKPSSTARWKSCAIC